MTKTILTTAAGLALLATATPCRAQTPLTPPRGVQQPPPFQSSEDQLIIANDVLAKVAGELHRCSRELTEMQADQLVTETEGGRGYIKRLSARCGEAQGLLDAAFRNVRAAEVANGR